MGLAEEIQAEARQRGTGCGVGRLWPLLTEEDAGALRGALETPTVSADQIGRALTRLGFDVSGQTVGRHRRGDCNCNRRASA